MSSIDQRRQYIELQHDHAQTITYLQNRGSDFDRIVQLANQQSFINK